MAALKRNVPSDAPDTPETESEQKRQKGFVLVLSMILLAMLTLIAFSAMDTATVEQNLAGNAQFLARSLGDAESSLEQGETYIRDNIGETFETFRENNSTLFSGTTDTDFTAPTNANVTIEYVDSNVVVEIAQPYTGALPGCGSGETGCMDYYRITAVSEEVGGTVQTVQSIFGNYIPYQ